MISASLSLSLPRLGWKSTSMPRSLKICTAAGDNASEMRTLGFVIWCFLHPSRRRGWPARPKWDECLGAISSPSPRSYGERARVRGICQRARRLEPLTRRYAPTSPRNNGARSKTETLRGLRQRRLHLGERPIDPLRQQRNVVGFDGRAAPDSQARRRIAIVREIVTGAFLLYEGNELLGEVDLRVRRQRGDRGIDHLHAHRGIGPDRRILGEEIDPRRLRLPVG